MSIRGTYPFGAPLRSLVQEDHGRRRVFVLGVYASAVHATWIAPSGRRLVQALAVASEPVIFWDGDGAEDLVAALSVPQGAGRLVAAPAKFNGPSGRALDHEFLKPLGIQRDAAWLCDLVPHTCLNPSQLVAIRREYEPRRAALSLPDVDLPPAPRVFADDERRREIVAEVEAADPDVVVLLGDVPIREWLYPIIRHERTLAAFGTTAETYGRLHEVELAGRRRAVLPLAHPRQVGGLGAHSLRWRSLHATWRSSVAGQLFG